MGRFNASPSTFSQGGTRNPYELGFSFSNEDPSSFGKKSWSRNIAKRNLRIAGQCGPMSPQIFGDMLLFLGLSVKDVSSIFLVKSAIVRRWRNGKADIPLEVARVLEILRLQAIQNSEIQMFP